MKRKDGERSEAADEQEQRAEDERGLAEPVQLDIGRLHADHLDEALVSETFERMAKVVDKQNAGDPQYQPMAGHFETSLAFKAAKALVFEGRAQPSGYTEPLLHKFRLEVKQRG